MNKILAQVEAELPELLLLLDWNSLHVTYEPPEVRRLWRQWGEFRIFLHEIHACEPSRALYHPHPWPSIVKIVEHTGSYSMGIGFGAGLEPPPLAMTTWLTRGSVYEMNHRDGWHYVAPTGTSWSLMVTGTPWKREMPRSDHPPQKPLGPSEALRLQSLFQRFYPPRAKPWSAALAEQLASLPPFPDDLRYTAWFEDHPHPDPPPTTRWIGGNVLDVPGIARKVLQRATVAVGLANDCGPTCFLFRGTKES